MSTLSPSLKKKTARRTTAPAKPDEEQKARKPAYLRRKMAVSQPQDKEEQEADQVAGEVKRATKEPGPREDKEMISSKPVPSALRLLRRVNSNIARQPVEEEEEPIQTKLRRAEKSEEEKDKALQRRLSRQAEEEEAQPKLRRLYRVTTQRAEEEEAQTKLRRVYRAIAHKAEEEEAQTKLSRSVETEEPKEEMVQKRLTRAATAEQEEPQETTADSESSTSDVETSVEEQIENSRGQGAPLPETVLNDM